MTWLMVLRGWKGDRPQKLQHNHKNIPLTLLLPLSCTPVTLSLSCGHSPGTAAVLAIHPTALLRGHKQSMAALWPCSYSF